MSTTSNIKRHKYLLTLYAIDASHKRCKIIEEAYANSEQEAVNITAERIFKNEEDLYQVYFVLSLALASVTYLGTYKPKDTP